MGKILFKDFKVFDGRGFIAARDVLVDGERILAVGNGLEERGAEIIEGYGKILSPGFVDLHAHFRDPGGEWNEDIASGAKAGAAGGFPALRGCGSAGNARRRGRHAVSRSGDN